MAGAGMLCLLAMASWQARAGEAPTRVWREGETIVYQGLLSPEANARVGQLLAAEEGIGWLRITSGGGDVNLGMDLGELVRTHALSVEVIDYCASSCANYVFPAGQRKRLPADSAVIWHGSAIQAGIGDLSAIDFSALEKVRGRTLSDEEKAQAAEEMGLTAYFDALRERQQAFFADLGVDPRVTVFGQDVGCGCDWTIPVVDMARFGISGIEAPDGYGAHLEPNGKPIVLLRLQDHPQYAASIGPGRAPQSPGTGTER